MPSNAASEPGELLSIRGLCVDFDTDAGAVPAVRGIDLDIGVGETVALVGESGCGKSVTAMSVMRLISGRISAGSIRFQGQDLGRLAEAEMRRIRGAQVGMIFQEPMTSLNPVFTVGKQIEEVLILHQLLAPRAARRQALELLRRVGIPSPEQRIAQYPHELSGGMKQRVMIAMAIACRPKLLIADEPTTALDVTIQAQIMDLLRSLKQEFGMAVLLITHDLGVVAHFAERVAVMYAGKNRRARPSARHLQARRAPVHPSAARRVAGSPEPRQAARSDPGARAVSAKCCRRVALFARAASSPSSPVPACYQTCSRIAPGHRAACLVHDPARAPVRVGTG